MSAVETNENHGGSDELCSMPTYYYAGDAAKLGQFMTDAQDAKFREAFSEISCCANCRFWDEVEDPSWDKNSSLLLQEPRPHYCGECRRRAPVILHPLPDEYELEPHVPWWPETMYNDFCGEFDPG
jgi:hypothetical protein